jgi:hypothetical protein
MTRFPASKALIAETPYQIVMIAAILELLLLATLAPRSSGTVPLCFEAVAGLRLAALVLLGALLASSGDGRRHHPWEEPAPMEAAPDTKRSRLEAVAALALWGAILLPPELWAFALEARAGIPWTLVSSVLLGVGTFAAIRAHARLGWSFPAAIVAVYAAQGFRLEPLSPALIVFAVVGVVLLVVPAKNARKPSIPEGVA